MMRILIIHNRYSRTGGEEKVVAVQEKLLASAGHEVRTYIRDYHEQGRFRSAFTALRNPAAVSDVLGIVSTFHPDAAIVHNLFPVISGAVVSALRRSGIPVAMTVHNYRLFCPIGLFFRKGKICTKCADSSIRETNCLLRRCQGSFAGSAAFTARGMFSRKAGYFNDVSTFLSCSEFQRRNLVKYGIPEEKTAIVPNCTDAPESRHEKEDYIAFAGRLSPEKGVDLLMKIAAGMPETEFRIAGTKAEGFAMPNVPQNVRMLGQLDSNELTEFYGKAKALLFTSTVWEAMPLTPLEAMAAGTAVVANRVSSLPEITDNGRTGILFEGAAGGVSALKRLLSDDNLRESLESAGRERVRELYSPQRYLDRLTEELERMVHSAK